MSRVAKVSSSNKITLSPSLIQKNSQLSSPIKVKNANRRSSTNSNGNGQSVRISSSKYVAAQRAKARDIVLSLQRKNIKLIAIDFDNTLLSIHTSGYYQGTVDNLLDHIRTIFYYFIQEILESPSFNQTLHVCIVSFSSQEQLIRQLLQLAFKTSLVFWFERNEI
jgi:hypothetical protein